MAANLCQRLPPPPASSSAKTTATTETTKPITTATTKPITTTAAETLRVLKLLTLHRSALAVLSFLVQSLKLAARCLRPSESTA
jgi:hypothetical protein